MSELYDPVPLGRVYLRKDGPSPDERPAVVLLMEMIERAFEGGELAVYGRRPDRRDRERIWPADHEIDWVGKPTDTSDYCSVCAFRRGLADWTGAKSRAAMNDAFEDLAIARADLDKLCKERQRLAAKSRSTDAMLDEWMSENAKRLVKRDLIIGACRREMNATVRAAAAAFERLPADQRLGRGKKPLVRKIEH